MTTPAGPLPPPGWYPDPSGQAPQRWWSGAQWTDHVHPPAVPADAPAPAPAPAPQPSRREAVTLTPHGAQPDPAFDADTFRVHQRFNLMVNTYEVLRSDGPRIAIVRQKLMAMRERIEGWRDDTRTDAAFFVQAEKVIDVHGSYLVTDGHGHRIGSLRKQFGASLLRSTWTIEDARGAPVARVTESSQAIAVLRRVKGFVDLIPVVGWILSLVPIPYGFTFLAVDGREVGSYRRSFGLFDRYVLDLSGDRERVIERRLAVALAVCLDALQSR